MNIKNTLTATLSREQELNWEDGNWGAYTRSGSRKVARTVIAMLREGIENRLITDDYRALMRTIAERSGVDEVTDNDAMDSVMWMLEEVLNGSIPTLRADSNKDEDEEDDL